MTTCIVCKTTTAGQRCPQCARRFLAIIEREIQANRRLRADSDIYDPVLVEAELAHLDRLRNQAAREAGTAGGNL